MARLSSLILTTTTARATEALGRRFGRQLTGGEIIGLQGSLGSGKTTFVRGVLRSFGLRRATSPTFVLVKSIPVRRGRIRTLLHADLYRLLAGTDLSSLGLSEHLARPEAVVLIEWSDRLTPPPRGMCIIRFFVNTKKRRRIILPRLAATFRLTPGRPARARRRSRVTRR